MASEGLQVFQLALLLERHGVKRERGVRGEHARAPARALFGTLGVRRAVRPEEELFIPARRGGGDGDAMRFSF